MWHPDKNPPHMSELCKSLVRRIATLADRFISGSSADGKPSLSIDDETDGGVPARPQLFNSDQYDRRARSDRQRYDACGGVAPNYSRPNPQVTEARRWLRQAQFDLQSANNDCGVSGSKFPEWFCHKFHQVCMRLTRNS